MNTMKTLSAAAMRCAALGVALTGFALTSAAAEAPSDQACAARNNDLVTKLVECIRQQPLWDHLVNFQRIADQNPGPDGHASRNSGEPGYKASVDYVAGLMKSAGYKVTVQQFTIPYFALTSAPLLIEQSPVSHTYVVNHDYSVARPSVSGVLTGTVQPVGGIIIPPTGGSQSGCTSGDFAAFTPGHIALIQRGSCLFATKVANAVTAGATGVIIFNEGDPGRTGTYTVDLGVHPNIPVIGLASYALGASLYQQALTGPAPVVHMDIQTVYDPNRADYNLIADSPYGDDAHVVIAEGHLDAIYGAGILDNASGSATLLEVALKMAKTRTRNQLRYIWFGGEEIGLLGSAYYAQHLSPAEKSRIVFDLDADVTATPNYDILIADPTYASNAGLFPANVIPASQLGNQYFVDYFTSVGLPVYPVSNDGTDSNSFSLAGIPNSGILTGQDCCKSQDEVNIWGGSLGNYEGNIPSFDGGCVDRSGLWCDNLSNANPHVLEFMSKAFAYATFKLANDVSLNPGKK